MTEPCQVREGFSFECFADMGEGVEENRLVRMIGVDENDEIVHPRYYPFTFQLVILKNSVI